MKLLLSALFLWLSLASVALAEFNDAAELDLATRRASIVATRAQRTCQKSRMIYTACLKNLQMQAIEKKIGVLEQLALLESRPGLERSSSRRKVEDLMHEIDQESRFLSFYRDRNFDGDAAFENDLKHLFLKRSFLGYLKRNKG